MATTKILLLSASAGNGHVRAAQALEAAAARHFPGETEVRHVDILKEACGPVRWFYGDGYMILIRRMPLIWRWVYNSSNIPPGSFFQSKIQATFERFVFRRVVALAQEWQPDHIICTHFTPVSLLTAALAAGKLKAKLWVQVTDFDLHWLWVRPGVEGYFVASDLVAATLEARNVPKERVQVTGIPIMPVFADPQPREECARQFNLDPAKLTILMSAGGASAKGTAALADRLLARHEGFQFVVVAGRNPGVFDTLKPLAAKWPGRFLPIGFTDQMHRLMGCADLMISKPGGLTTSECLAMGLPMIAYAPVAGQEESNSDYLLEHGAAVRANDMEAVELRLAELLAHPERLAEMRQRTVRLGHSRAAVQVLERLLGR